ncbi:UDP-N-acetylmuramyl pentapeptide synthase [Eggerthella sp. YY7918]|nr:UDP-N-acetylmuramyl pentapeptide synthase [Eggerthella sp. YY7918]
MSVRKIGVKKYRVVVKGGVDPETGKPRYFDKIESGCDRSRAVATRQGGHGAKMGRHAEMSYRYVAAVARGRGDHVRFL